MLAYQTTGPTGTAGVLGIDNQHHLKSFSATGMSNGSIQIYTSVVALGYGNGYAFLAGSNGYFGITAPNGTAAVFEKILPHPWSDLAMGPNASAALVGTNTARNRLAVTVMVPQGQTVWDSGLKPNRDGFKDAMAFHPYSDLGPDGNINYLNRLYAEMNSISGMGSKPIWVTEIGYTSDANTFPGNTGGSTTLKANYLSSLYQKFLDWGIQTPIFWYDFNLDPNTNIIFALNIIMNVTKQICIIIAFLFTYLFFPVVSPWVCAANFYFDSVSGSDTTGDGSIGNPWQTIVKIQETVHCNAGSNIFLKAGSEWNANVLDGTNPCGLNIVYGGDGLAIYQNGISIKSYGSGAKPRLVNPRQGDTNAKVILIQGSNTTIDGLMIDDRLASDPAPTPAPGVTTKTASGIYVFLGNNNVIKNNEIKGVGQGVAVEGSNNLVTNNYIHDLQMIIDNNNSGADDYGAAGVLLFKSNNEVSYNTLQNCKAHSYDFAPTFQDGGAMEIYGKSGDTVQGNYIHHNTAQDNEGFMEFGGQTGGAVGANTFSYNLMKNNTRVFYFNLSGPFALDSVTGINFYHNTIVDTNSSLYGYYFDASSTPSTNILSLKNNIFYYDSSIRVALFSAGIAHTNNVYYTFNGTTNNVSLGYTADSSERLANPSFTNAASNYTLTGSSPAINMGLSLGTVTKYDNSSVAIQTLDLAGNTVPVGAGPDAGTYEYQIVDTPTPSITPTQTITPSPTITPTSIPGSGGNNGDEERSGSKTCSDIKPSSSPVLFQANTYADKAELFINPAGKPYTDYLVSYAYFPNAEQWGVTFPMSQSSGAIHYTINFLPQNSILYVKVRAGNGCATGDWSNILRIQTQSAKAKFSNKQMILQFTLFDQVKGIFKGVMTSAASLLNKGIHTKLK